MYCMPILTSIGAEVLTKARLFFMKNGTDNFVNFLRKKMTSKVVTLVESHSVSDPRDRLVNKSKVCIKPKTTKEVSIILKEANRRGVQLVPVGGSTGLVGGQIAESDHQVSISLEKMNAINFSEEDNLVTVQAGAVLADIKKVTSDAGRFFPLSIASEGSCQIGGNLATNAGGLNVLRYGSIRDLCLGIEAVLPNGNIMSSMKALTKNNMGFDIKSLLIGSEGTLAVITGAVFKTYPLPIDPMTAIISVNKPAEALNLFNVASNKFGDTLMAFELMKCTGVDFLNKAGFKVRYPFSKRAPWIILIDFDVNVASVNLRVEVEKTLCEFFDKNWVNEIVVSNSLEQKQEFWKMRELIPSANRRIGSLCSNDICVPIKKIPEFIKEADQTLMAISDKIVINCFGHMGDGNLHYNVFPISEESRESLEQYRPEIIKNINDLVRKFSGSISAEHGIGRLKSAELKLYEDPGKFNAMLAIKSAIDPKGILNPGVIFNKGSVKLKQV